MSQSEFTQNKRAMLKILREVTEAIRSAKQSYQHFASVRMNRELIDVPLMTGSSFAVGNTTITIEFRRDAYRRARQNEARKLRSKRARQAWKKRKAARGKA